MIIPSYGGEQRLPALLSALAQQQVDRAWEVILVLDGTPDNSSDIAAGYAQEVPLTILELENNRGRVGALNAGFAASSGDVVVRCDDDLVPSSGFVEGHAVHHESGDPVGVIGFCRNVYPAGRYARVYGVESDRRHWSEALARSPERRWIHWAANCSVPRAVWAQVGPYDSRYVGWGWEDIDWGYRLHNLGVPIEFDSQLAVDHTNPVTTCRSRIDRAYRSGEARRRFETIHGVVASEGTATWWSWFVGKASKTLGAHRRGVGSFLDAAIRVVPRRLGRVMIAFAVEAASAAGYDAGEGQDE